MKRYITVILVLLVFGLDAQKIPTGANSSNEEIPKAPMVQKGEIVVKYKSGYDKFSLDPNARQDHPFGSLGVSITGVDNIFRQIETKAGRASSRSGIDFGRYQLLKFDQSTDVMSLVSALNRLEVVEYAEPIYVRESTFIPNDASFLDQIEYLDPIRATQAWDISKGSRDVVVAVVDAGLDYRHEDLRNKIAVNSDEIRDNGIDDDDDGFIDNYFGWDFAGSDVNTLEQDNDPIGQADNIAHGTWVAGFAAADTDNGRGMAGVGFDSRYMAIKTGADNDFSGAGGSSFLYRTPLGVLYAADQGADVINMSYGGPGYSQFTQDIMTYAALEKGVVLVASAGNAGSSTVSYPAGYDHVLSVAASSNNDRKADFSNFGSWVDIIAPGDNVFTVSPNNDYTSVSGTSFSGPIVAGAAALLRAQYPDFNPEQIRDLLMNTTDFIDSVNNNSLAGQLGTGRLNIEKALTVQPPSFNVTNFEVLNTNNDVPSQGEVGTLNLEVENILFNSSASATMSVTVLGQSAVVLSDTVFSIASIPASGTKSFPSFGTLTVSDSAAFNSEVVLRIVFEDTVLGYGEDLLIRAPINPLRTNSASVPFLLADGGDFEVIQDQFASGALSGGYNAWELGVPGNELTEVNSGVNAWKTGLTEDMPNLSFSSALQSPIFNLSDQSRDYRLSFYKSMETQFCNAPAAVQVQYSLDGLTWSRLGSKGDPGSTNWYNKAPGDGCEIEAIIIPDQQGWIGTFSNEYTEYNVSALKGNENVSFRIVMFVSDVFTGNPDDGFMVDDFQLESRDPVASFEISRTVVYTTEEVDFIYTSSGATGFVWDFGDGAVSTEASPKHAFTEPGTYSVKLTIQSAIGSDEIIKENIVTVLPNLTSSLSLADGGDFEQNQLYFGAENVAGTGFELGVSTIDGKAGTASGDFAWVTGIDDELYLDVGTAYLYTPSFDFQFIGEYTFKFKSNFRFEDTWDGFEVQYTTDQGANWIKLNDEIADGWYNTISDPQAVFGVSVPMFSGNTLNEFQQFFTDVSFLSGRRSVAFRFVFRTDANTVDVGMALDDVEVTYPAAGALAADFATEGYSGCQGQEVTFRSTSTGTIDRMTWDFGTNAVPGIAVGPGPHVVRYDSLGATTAVITIGGGQESAFKSIEILSGAVHTPTLAFNFLDNGNAFFTSSEGDTYQWILGQEPIEGATENTYEATERGTYAVEVAIDGCARKSANSSFIVTSVEDQQELTMFPNPSSDGKMSIVGRTDIDLQKATLTLYDLTGKDWSKEVRVSQQNQIDLSSIPEGAYILRLMENNTTFTAKIIVQ